jgi:hypothetical protein
MLNENEAGFTAFAWHTMEGIFENIIKKRIPTAGPIGQPRWSRYRDPHGGGKKPAVASTNFDHKTSAPWSQRLA